MAKRHGDSTHGVVVKSKKRRGIKIRTVNILESDDEGAVKINTEYARLLKTRITTSGKVDSVTMDSLRFVEAIGDTANSSPEQVVEGYVDGHEEVPANDAVPSTKTKKRRKKKNDSVCCTLFTGPSPRANDLPDQDADLVGCTSDSPR